MNNADKVDKSFELITTKTLLKQGVTNFPVIPGSRTEISLSIWLKAISRTLKASPWDIDGTSILEMHLSPILSEALESYRIRSMKLYLIMTKLLQAAKCQGILNHLDSRVTSNDGVSLLLSSKEAILPRTSLQILDVLSDLCTCHQENGETVEAFRTRVEHLFTRLKSLDCTTIKQLQMATLQRNFLYGAYSGHKSLNWIQQKLKNNK